MADYAHAFGFTEVLRAADAGLKRWAEKPGNAKWWKRIDGTPIPNDLLVNIAESVREAPLLAQPATAAAPPADSLIAKILEVAQLTDESDEGATVFMPD